MKILALNCGSSSLKYALFEAKAQDQDDDALFRASVDIGADGVADHDAAVASILDELDRRGLGTIDAVGHRLVHGGPDHHRPERVTPELIAALSRVVPFAPLHLPIELRAIESVRGRLAEIPQVVCFDTAFHRAMPEVARRFALPLALHDEGLFRYGFHGLSYEYVVETLGAENLSRAVLAHLGNGASMAAVRDGHSIDTTMGFTPTAGLVMGTRSGDLDPGLLVYLVEHRGYQASDLDRLVNHQAGLLALSGTTSDMQRLLARRANDERAAFAIEVFCYQARKWIGAFAAALGGIDTLVFTGGIGQHAAAVRFEIGRGLDHLGLTLDATRNAAGEAIISSEASRCTARVLATDEERMIARHTLRLLGEATKQPEF